MVRGCSAFTDAQADLNSPRPFLFAGYRQTLVRIDSETGSPMHATGLFLVTVIGVPLIPLWVSDDFEEV